jgi:multidrug efflux pump subunit AcrA (membrane-fusion protein)
LNKVFWRITPFKLPNLSLSNESERFVPTSLASPIPSIAEADRLLEGLDQLARSEVTEGEFLQQFLIVLRGMSGGAVALLLPIRGEWVTVATAGEVQAGRIRSVTEMAAKTPPPLGLEGLDPEGPWIGARIDSVRKEESGILWIGYHSGDAEPLIASGRLLLEPFCEILRARQASSGGKAGSEWVGRMEDGIRCLSQPESPQDARQVLVDQLVLAMEGGRASLVTRDSNGFQLRCSSGASSIDRMSSTVKKLEKVAGLASQQENVFRWTEEHPNRDEYGVFRNGIAFAWDRSSDGSANSWLIVEWPESAAMDRALPLLSSWCRTMYPVWQQTERWTRLPRTVQRRLSRHPNAATSRNPVKLWRWVGGTAIVGLLAGLALPIPMTIDSKAVLEPVSRRLIHASADGYVDELLVEDGDRVVSQQEIARLRSPSLELQVEEAVGQLRAIVEKRNGLKIAINQLSPNAPDALANQTRLSTELSMLDSSETRAREMLEFYQAEKSRLVLRSPIDGVVVARRLRQELENRPIRRGDPLLQVMDLSGAWQLRIQVADRDTNYVDRFYSDSAQTSAQPSATDTTVSYTFDSLPGEPFTARVTQLARVIENRDGTGGYQEVLADVSREDVSKVHMGATARVRFVCGRESFAFVWSRPLIEFLQTRFRLFSRSQESLSPSPSNSL